MWVKIPTFGYYSIFFINFAEKMNAYVNRKGKRDRKPHESI